MTHSRAARLLTTTMVAGAAYAALTGNLLAAPDAQKIYPEIRQVVPEGTIITPSSSQIHAEDAGLRAHTNIKIFQPRGRIHINATSPSGKYETPASLACVYGITKKVSGCNPETLTTVATGGSKVIAIVDAYDDPTAAADLEVYSKQYGLPDVTGSNFQVLYGSGSKPQQDSTGGWELEESLDMDMAHALAPNAKIILVEASSASIAGLLQAEVVAAKAVAAAGGGEITNSWGGSESSNEETYESTFTGTNAVFFASTGDSPGTEFPSILQNVVGVGGTTINRSGTGKYMSETAWADGGGGESRYVPIPSYQSVISKIVGKNKGVPDVALDANPNSGAWLYDTTPYNGQVLHWEIVGGTSLASPATAALVNNAASFAATSDAELTTIYANLGNKLAFRDITKGACSNGGAKAASKGWDYCTGVGSSLGATGK